MATFKTGWMKKMIDNVSTRIFAISHVKSTYYDYAGGTTLDEVLIETEDSDQEAPEENEISPAILSKLNETNSEVDALKEEVDELKEGAISLANNLTTTEEGYALDARQGKALNDKLGSTDISTIGDGTVTNAISTLNSNLNKGYIEVVADGTKTLKTILSEISNLIDYSKVNYESKFITKDGELIFVFSVTQLYTNCVQLSSCNIPGSNMLWVRVIQLWTDNERIQYTVSTLSGDGIITLDDTLTSISKNGSVYRFIY